MAKNPEISLDPENANTHNEKSLDAVKGSLEGCGAGRSIVVDRNGRMIGGEATYLKAQELGLELQ